MRAPRNWKWLVPLYVMLGVYNVAQITMVFSHVPWRFGWWALETVGFVAFAFWISWHNDRAYKRYSAALDREYR